MIYAYYIPSQGLLGGEAALALEAQAYYLEKLGLDPRFAGHYDGATIYGAEGALTLRVVLQNFFTDQLDVKTHDYPYTISTIIRMCGECGGEVINQPPQDDFLTIKLRGYDMSVVIPQHILLPKCCNCGEIYLGQSDYNRISSQMIKELS
jgi:hypothetical protein